MKKQIARCFVVVLWSMIAASFTVAQDAARFEAIGPTVPVKMAPQTTAVEVHFDMLPTIIDFRLPAFPTLISENGIGYCNNYAETYDPETGGHFLSFEVMQDKENRYARMWIDRQNEARIVVRVMGALCDKQYRIAHTSIPSGSPYGAGDWSDEWYYIYPDGISIRKVKIYTGLAPYSRPFGFDRRPPSVIHEFQESYVFRPGKREKLINDVDIKALTLIKMNGESKIISWDPYPDNFGEFMTANIQVVNIKSRYKPFTIVPPDGVIMKPLDPGARKLPLPDVFMYALGHINNFKHYERTKNTLSQIYLAGMTDTPDLSKQLVPLAKSWLKAPELVINGQGYQSLGYEKMQRAYVLSQIENTGDPMPLDFELAATKDSPIVNPAFVIKGWGTSDAKFKINGKEVKRGKYFRLGHEWTENGIDLVIWIKFESTTPVRFSISKIGK